MAETSKTSSSSKILYLDLADVAADLAAGRKLPLEKKVASPGGNGLCAALFQSLEGRAAIKPDLFARHTKTVFNSGEHKIAYDDTVAGRQVFITLNFPFPDETTMPPAMFQLASALLTNNYLQLAMLSADAARRAGAAKVHLLMPNYAYARQDKTHKQRAAISAAVVAKQFEDYFDSITCLHLHSPAIEGMLDAGNLTNISPSEIFAPSVVCRDPDTFASIAPGEMTAEGVTRLFNRLCFASPDFGGAANARDFAKYCKKFAATLLDIDEGKLPDIPLALIDKRRPGPNESEIMNVLGRENVIGRRTIMIDDMLDTAGTAIHAATAYKDAGADGIEMYATHGYCLGPALEGLSTSVIDKVTITDSMEPRPSVRANPKIRVLSIAPILAQAIADLTTEPEPNLDFHARHLDSEDFRQGLGRYVGPMLQACTP